MENIKAVIFDLDNTLCDRKKAFYRHAENLADDYLEDISLDEKFIERLIALDNNGYSVKNDTYAKICEEFPMNADADTLKGKWNINAKRFSECEPFAKEILEYLKDKYILALLTNGLTKTQNIKLDTIGLRKYFTAVMVSESTGYLKPDKEIFELICKEIGVNPSQAVYIGDQLVNDYYGAINAGMNAVLYDRYYENNDDNINKIHSLIELKRIL